MTGIIQVQTTTDHERLAREIAEELVNLRLASCVQIGGPITSVYRWQGSVETAAEWICAVKTLDQLFPLVEQRIRQLHSYEEPEIIATSITHVSASYAGWLRSQLIDPESASSPPDQPRNEA